MSFFGNGSWENNNGSGTDIDAVKKVNNKSPDVDGNVSLSATDVGSMKSADITTAINTAKTDSNTYAKGQSDAVQTSLNTHKNEKGSTTAFGHFKADGNTITVNNGVISAKQVTLPSVSKFTTTTETDDTHDFIYKTSIPILPTDDLDIIYNGETLNDSDWSIVNVGGENVIALSVTEGDTVDVNIVSGRIYRGFNTI